MRLALVASLFLVSGCLGRAAANHAADVAARQHGCSRDRVHVESDAGNWTYWLRVCGRRRLYSTRDGNYVDITATVAGGSGGGGDTGFDTGSDVVTRETWRDDDFERLRRLVDSDVRTCVPGRSDELVVAVTLTTRGHATGASVSSAVTTDERTCIVGAFSGIRLSGRARAPAMAELRWTFDVAPAPAESGGAETAARAAIDAQREAIAACLGGAAALDVTIAPDGSVTISARGALAGTAEETCARAVLGAVVVSPPPSAATTIVHAVAP